MSEQTTHRVDNHWIHSSINDQWIITMNKTLQPHETPYHNKTIKYAMSPLHCCKNRHRLVLGMMLNCIHIFIFSGSFLYWCVMWPAFQRFFIHSCFYLRILIISYLATFFGTNSLSVLMCRKEVNQSIKQEIILCNPISYLTCGSILQYLSKQHRIV